MLFLSYAYRFKTICFLHSFFYVFSSNSEFGRIKRSSLEVRFDCEKRSSLEVPRKFPSTVQSEVPRKFASTVKSEVPEEVPRKFPGSSQEVPKEVPRKFPGSSLFSQLGKRTSLFLGKFPKISIVFCFNRVVLANFRRTF